MRQMRTGKIVSRHTPFKINSSNRQILNPEARILFAACKGCSAKHRQIPYIKKISAAQDLLHLAALCKFIHQLIQVAYLLR